MIDLSCLFLTSLHTHVVMFAPHVAGIAPRDHNLYATSADHPGGLSFDPFPTAPSPPTRYAVVVVCFVCVVCPGVGARAQPWYPLPP